MFAVGIFAGFIRGKDSVIPAGRELKAHLGEDIGLVVDYPPRSKEDIVAISPVKMEINTEIEAEILLPSDQEASDSLEETQQKIHPSNTKTREH